MTPPPSSDYWLGLLSGAVAFGVGFAALILRIVFGRNEVHEERLRRTRLFWWPPREK